MNARGQKELAGLRSLSLSFCTFRENVSLFFLENRYATISFFRDA